MAFADPNRAPDDAGVRAVLQALPDGKAVTDRDGRILFANRAVQTILGYTESEILGQPLGFLFADREGHGGGWARSAQQERPLPRALPVAGRCRDGRELPLEFSVSPLELPAGSFLLATLRDVSARKQAEAELRASQARFAGILDIAADAIISVNPEHRIVLFNQGAEAIFGYTAEEILGQPLDLLLPERFRCEHGRQMAEFAAGSKAARKMGERREIYGRRKDGSEFPAEASISKLGVDGELVLTAMLRDVTVRKEAEQQIRQLNDELEARVAARTAELAESNRQLARRSEENETFVYSVSHDLRSPLVNLEGFSRELRTVCDDVRAIVTQNELPDEVRRRGLALLDGDMAESIRYIQTAVARLSSIIDALLRLSRAGRVVYSQQRVDVEAVVRRIVESMRVTSAERGAEISVASLPPAWGDPAAIEQIFANLIGNALNYLDRARPGRIEVGVDAEPAPDLPGSNREQHTYLVRDNGLGIPEAYRPKVFQAFQRLHPDVAAGEGMGLAIVRRIVERHAGRVWVESNAGQGTTFFVALPAPPLLDKTKT